MEKITKEDTLLLRELAKRQTDAASHPIMEKRRKQWEANNALRSQRPMVWVDQICWNEINVDDDLTIKSENPICRKYEDIIRKTLYRHKHMQADQVVESYLEVPVVLNGYNAGFVDWEDNFDCGMSVKAEYSHTDITNDIKGQKYIPQIINEDDIEKIKMPIITHDKEQSEKNLNFVKEIFGDTIEVRQRGCHPAFKVWDSLLQWCGIENLLVNFAMEPEFVHALADRLTNAYLSGLDQLEALGVLGGKDTIIHCTGAYTDQLHPTPGAVKAKDMWTLNLSQIFVSTSVDMHDEFEATYSRKWFSRFGLGYYGCCEPLHARINMIRTIPNIRKISTSPWADYEVTAQSIGKDYVMSYKPQPSAFAQDSFDIEKKRKELEKVVDTCAKNGTPLEIILKDLSTTLYKPQRVWDWCRMASEVTGGDIV